MATRKPVLGSAARLLLSSAIIAAAPALARCTTAPDPVVAAADVQCNSNDRDFAQRLSMRNVPPLMCLEDVARVNDELFNAPVHDSAGYLIGHFRRIETKTPGDVVAVITLDPSRRTISMLTDHVRYEPGTRRIIADLTTQEIDLIPPSFPYG